MVQLHPGRPGATRILTDTGARNGAATEQYYLGKAGRHTCETCKAGDHKSTRHGKIGCMKITGRAPSDFVCQCSVKGAGA